MIPNSLIQSSDIARAPLVAHDHLATQEREQQEHLAANLGLSTEKLEKLIQGVEALTESMPYIHIQEKIPYYNGTAITIRKFCRTVYHLATKVTKISYDHNGDYPDLRKIKQLRIVTLHSLLDMLKYQLDDKLVAYGSMHKKPNYDAYYTPCIKSAKKVMKIAQQLLATFHSKETASIYVDLKEKFDGKKATIDLVESRLSKCCCCGVLGMIKAKRDSKNAYSPFL